MRATIIVFMLTILIMGSGYAMAQNPGPVNRTVLESYYQQPGETYDDAKTEGALETIADQVDANWIYTSGLVDKEKLTNFGIINVKDTGAVGDGTTDDTAAIDNAIASSDTLGIPDGNYLYTGNSLTGYYPYIGNGVVYKADGTPHPRFVKDLGTTYILQNLKSYVGFVNHLFDGDDATRVYIMPKDTVTTGAGGVIKVFGDPYHLGVADYRDLGIYFHADQNGHVGSNGSGVFWINSKVLGSYTDKNPDIGFSFQDGQHVAGRFMLVKHGEGVYNTVLVLGSSGNQLEQSIQDIKLALNGAIGFNDNTKANIRWRNSTANANNLLVFNPDDVTLKLSGSDIVTFGKSSINVKVPIIADNRLSVTTTVTTIDVTGNHRVKFNVASAHTVSTITGVNGQKITILFANGNTTIQNNANIKLAGAANFVGSASDILVLENFDGVWYEVSRSLN